MKRVKKGGTHRGKEEKKKKKRLTETKKKNEGKEKNFFFLFSQIIFGAAGGPIFNPSPKYKVRHDGSFQKKNFFRGQLLKEKKRPKLKSKIFGTKPKRRK